MMRMRVDDGISRKSPQRSLLVPLLILVLQFSPTAARNVTTFAGLTGTSGAVDGTSTAARFNSPMGITMDALKVTLYVADTGNHAIRQVVLATGQVTTFAGILGISGTTNGIGTSANFFLPRKVVFDTLSVNMYVSEGNHAIRRIVFSSKTVSLYSGVPGTSGATDGSGLTGSSGPKFNLPTGLAMDHNDYLYIADTENHAIRRISVSGSSCTTIAGSLTNSGNVEDTGTAARFNYPMYIVLTADNSTLYIVDQLNHKVRKLVISTSAVTSIAGTAAQGYTLGLSTTAGFSYPSGIACTSDSSILVVTEKHTLRGISIPANQVTIYAGDWSPYNYGSSGYTDGWNSLARFHSPSDVAIDFNNAYAFTVGTAEHSIRRILLKPSVTTTIAGTSGSVGNVDGTDASAQFDKPFRLALNSVGHIYLSCLDSHTVRKIVYSGSVATVTTVIGTAYTPGITDSPALLNGPGDIAIDGSDNVYVPSGGSYTIKKLSTGGTVSTVVGTANTQGMSDGTGTGALLYGPQTLIVDSTKNAYLYLGDDSAVRRITQGTFVVTTVAGVANVQASVDGTGTDARFKYITGMVHLSSGIFYIGSYADYSIRKMTADYVVTTLIGVKGTAGLTEGTAGASIMIGEPYGFVYSASSDLLYFTMTGTAYACVVHSYSPTLGTRIVIGQRTFCGIQNGPGPHTKLAAVEGLAVGAHGELWLPEYSNHILRRAVFPVIDIELSPSKIRSGTSNLEVGKLYSYNFNYDVLQDTTFQLVNGGESQDNSLFTLSGGNVLKLTISPRKTMKSVYSIRVKATDYFGYAFEKPIRVYVGTRTETMTLSASMSFSTSFSSSWTFTTSGTMSASLSQFTQTLTGSSSLSQSGPSTTFSASKTLSMTTTHTEELSSTKSGSLTGTLTVTKLLPPTRTQSFTLTQSFGTLTVTFGSLSASMSKSAALTLSVPLTESGTASLTAPTFSGRLSESFSVPLTESFSLSKDKQIYCGKVNISQCVDRFGGLCNLTESNTTCYSRRCGNMTDEETCYNQGCSWSEVSNCTKPRECRDVKDATECDSLISCRWRLNSCRPDSTPCSSQETAANCQAVDCSWNTKVSPRCFRPLRSPALCRSVLDSTTCSVQGCLWVAAQSRCYRWDAACEDLPPSLDSCSLISRCVYFQQRNRCISLDQLDTNSIVAARHPASVFPDEVFELWLYGAQLPISTQIGLIDWSRRSTCPVGDAFTTDTFPLPNISNYDKVLFANTVSEAAVTGRGNYSICVKFNSTVSLGPISLLSVDTPVPLLVGCTPTPNPPYQEEPFTVAVAGTGIDPVLGKYTVVPPGVPCPPYSDNLYRPVDSVTRGQAILSYRSSRQDYLKFCYLNRGLVPVACPNDVKVSGIPPWFNPDILRDIAQQQLPLIDGISNLIALNQHFCRGSAAPYNTKTFGVLAHPVTFEVQFGDKKSPYPESTVCAFALSPLSLPALTDGPRHVILLTVNYVSLEPQDAGLLFVPTSATNLPSCASFTSESGCVAELCEWNAPQKKCRLPLLSMEPQCPQTISGFSLHRVLTTDVFNRAGSRGSIALTIKGAIVIACSAAGPKTGLGLSMSYQTQNTFCPNDCTDAKSTTNGVCDDSTRTCQCNSGRFGDDCSQATECAGVGPRASGVQSSVGNMIVRMNVADPCGTLVTANPARNPPSNSASFKRMQRYGIGLELSQLRLTEHPLDAAVGAFCNRSYILLRKGSSLGRLITRICPKDVAQAASTTLGGTPGAGAFSFRTLQTDALSVYVEYAGGAVGDQFSLSFTAVSTVCPGTAQGSLVPQTAEEKCDGRGECYEVDYYGAQYLLDSAVECRCRSPFASSVPGDNCDSCGFGFEKTKFPQCPSAVSCPNNCSGHGQCVENTCRCDRGYFNINCHQEQDLDYDDGDKDEDLLTRMPLNRKAGGDITRSGAEDRTITSCELDGASIPCRSVNRTVGKSYARQKPSKTDLQVGDFISLNRRRQGNGSTSTANATFSPPPNVINSGQIIINGSSGDEGLSFNYLAPKDSFPHFIRTEGVSVSTSTAGGITVTAWIQATGLTEGFLFARTDSFFLPDGRSPALEKAAADIKDRNTPLSSLQLLRETSNVEMALLLNGPMKRVDLLVSNPQKKNVSLTSKEDWLYVRHFRLGPEVAGKLFDGSWRFFAFRLSRSEGRVEGQIFVDGFTKPAHSDFVQCVPWLPVNSRPATRSSNPSLDYPGESIWWGYRLVGALDELRLYRRPLAQRELINLGGSIFLTNVTISDAALIFLIVICLGSAVLMLLVAVGQFLYQKYGRAKKHREENEQKLADVIPAENQHVVDLDDAQASRNSSEKGSSSAPRKDSVLDAETRTAIRPKLKPRASVGSGDPSLDLSAVRVSQVDVDELSEASTEAADIAGAAELADPGDTTVSLEFIQSQLRESSKRIKFVQQHFLRYETSSNNTQNNAAAVKSKPVQIEEDEIEIREPDSGDPSGEVEFSTHASAQTGQEEMIRKKMSKALAEVERRIGTMEEYTSQRTNILHAHRAATQLNAIVALIPTESTERTVKQLGLIFGPVFDAIQVLAQISTFGFPQNYRSVFAAALLTMTIDLSSSGVSFQVSFYLLFVLSLLCLLALVLLRCTEPAASRKLTIASLNQVQRERAEAAALGRKYVSKIDKKSTVILILSGLLSHLLYMPMTRASVQAIFCHRTLTCEFDCYQDTTHVALVGCGVLALLLVTLGTPLFYWYCIHHYVTQYQLYLGVTDPKLTEKFWEPFNHAHRTPFSSLHENTRYGMRYFALPHLMYRAVLTVFAMALTPETTEQLICVTLWHVAATTVTFTSRPFLNQWANTSMSAVYNLIVVMLAVAVFSLLFPVSSAPGIVLILLTVAILFTVLGIAGYVLFVEDHEEPVKEHPNHETPEFVSPRKQSSNGAGAKLSPAGEDPSSKAVLIAVEQNSGSQELPNPMASSQRRDSMLGVLPPRSSAQPEEHMVSDEENDFQSFQDRSNSGIVRQEQDAVVATDGCEVEVFTPESAS